MPSYAAGPPSTSPGVNTRPGRRDGRTRTASSVAEPARSGSLLPAIGASTLQRNALPSRPIRPCLSAPIAGQRAGRCPLAASVLIDVDLVAVEVLHQDAGAVKTDVELAFELDTALFQSSVLAYTV